MTEMYFDINQKIIDSIYEEFNAEKIIDELVQKTSRLKGAELEDAINKFFIEYGKNLMTKALELGENYQDTTYKVIKRHAEKVGPFPNVPQRFIEICYLSVLQIEKVAITESNLKKLGYKIENCSIYNTLKEKMGENISNQMPCKHACILLAETLYENMKLETEFSIKALMAKDGYCHFLSEKKT
ncbi:MAG: hypothetical protein ACETWM_00230 [Candidatus Lokiarchaeia archaeon]